MQTISFRIALLAAIGIVASAVARGHVPEARDPFVAIAEAGEQREAREAEERRHERIKEKRRLIEERLGAERREIAEVMERARDRDRREEGFRDPAPMDPDLMHFARRELPFAVDEIADLLRSDEPYAREELGRWREYLRELQELCEHEPELYELEKRILVHDWEAERLGDRIRDLPQGNEKRAKMMQELDKMLEEGFDLKEQMRRRDIEILERELEEQRAILKKRTESRKEIIERRRQELTGEADALDW